MKIFLWIIASVIAIISLYLVFFFYQLNKAGNEAKERIGTFHPEITDLPDGKYTGSFNPAAKRFGAEVTFGIKNRQLGIIHFTKLFGTPGYGAPQQITAKIEETGDLDINAISGATITTNFAKAAIRDAIENGPM